MPRLRLVMMGTGGFAVPTFRALYAAGHDVAALFTQPVREAHGRKSATQSPMREVALEHGTPIFDPPSINEDDARQELAALKPELLIVCDYGQILADNVLVSARLGGVNLHGSLLPKYRGAAPVAWAIYRGEQETGVTVIHMTAGLDAGPSLGQRTLTIDSTDTSESLEHRLAELGAPLVCEVVDQLASGTARAFVQDQALATKARRLRKTDGLIDWRRSAAEIDRQIRALTPWPKAYTFWLRPDGEPLRLIVSQARVDDAHADAAPGTVLSAKGNELSIACGQGVLWLESIQPAGKRLLATDEFLRGYPVQVGQFFGSAE